jgi:hypothetical protein
MRRRLLPLRRLVGGHHGRNTGPARVAYRVQPFVGRVRAPALSRGGRSGPAAGTARHQHDEPNGQAGQTAHRQDDADHNQEPPFGNAVPQRLARGRRHYGGHQQNQSGNGECAGGARPLRLSRARTHGPNDCMRRITAATGTPYLPKNPPDLPGDPGRAGPPRFPGAVAGEPAPVPGRLRDESSPATGRRTGAPGPADRAARRPYRGRPAPPSPRRRRPGPARSPRRPGSAAPAGRPGQR